MKLAQGFDPPAGFSLTEEGVYTFDPSHPDYDHLANGESETLVIPVTVLDARGGASSTQITLTVTGTNDAPVASSEVIVTEHEAAMAVRDTLEAADVDDGAVLTYSIADGVEIPPGFTLHPDGSYVFDPAHEAYSSLAEGESRIMTLAVDVTDEHGATSAMQIKFTVVGSNNAAPEISASVARTVDEGGATITGQFTATDANENDILTFMLSRGVDPVDGFTINPDGSFSFDPTHPAYDHLKAGDTEVISIPVAVVDNHGASDTAYVQITVVGTNDAPVAGADVSAIVNEGAPPIIGRPTSSDVDDDATATYAVADGAQAPAGFSIAADGSFRFDPGDPAYDHLNAGEQLQLTVPMTVTDDQGATVTTRIHLTVTGTADAPVAGAQVVAAATEGGSVIHGAVLSTDADQHGVLTHSITGGGAAPDGFLLNGDGSFSFDPTHAAYDHLKQGDTEELVIPVTVWDEAGNEDHTQIRITVTGTNDKPLAEADQEIALFEDAPVVSGQLSATDVDDEARLVFSLPPDFEAPVGFSLNEDGSYTFDPSAAAYQQLGVGESATFMVPVTVTDEHGASSTLGVEITVSGTNDLPVVSGTTEFHTLEDVGILLTQAQLLEHAADIDGDQLRISNVRVGDGTLIDNQDGTWLFIPDENWYGTVDLTYDVGDGHATVSTGGSIVVEEVNDGPVAVDDTPEKDLLAHDFASGRGSWKGTTQFVKGGLEFEYGDYAKSQFYFGEEHAFEHVKFRIDAVAYEPSSRSVAVGALNYDKLDSTFTMNIQGNGRALVSSTFKETDRSTYEHPCSYEFTAQLDAQGKLNIEADFETNANRHGERSEGG
ncbi:MAG: hypothetical protein B0D96_04895 [Candidatus Sedimenticola endophacoides]|nr:MAG: hypothetical protein B0D96_04895 [Candidatus Sedimenticola endophacoides]